jgi:hypothetical protein
MYHCIHQYQCIHAFYVHHFSSLPHLSYDITSSIISIDDDDDDVASVHIDTGVASVRQSHQSVPQR